MSRKGGIKLPDVDGPPADPAQDPLSFLPDQPSDPGASNIGQAVSVDDIKLPDDKTQVQQLHESMATTDPDHNAKVLDLAKQTGQPPAFVDKNLPAIQQAAKAPAPSFFQQLDAQYPGTSDFLKKPENMAISHDDLPNVARHEDVMQQVKMASGILEEASAAWQHSLGGLITGGKPTLENNPDAPWYDKFASIPAGLAGDLPFMLAGGVSGGLGGTAVAGPVGGFVGAAAGGFGAPAAVKRGLLDHYNNGDIKSSDDLIARTKDILGEFAKQTAVGLAVEATGGLTGLAGKAATESATKAGYSATALSRIGMASSAAHLLGEAGTMEVAGKGVEGEKPSFGGFIENLATIKAMHMAGALPPVEYAKAAMNKAALSVLGDSAKDSKLRQRSPEAYAEMVKGMTENGQVFIPVDAAESYFQSKKIDPAHIMDQIGATDSYNEAKQTGGDIAIDLSQWLTKVAPTEHFQGLLDHTRLLDRDTPTADEVSQKTAEYKDHMQALEDAREAAKAAGDNPDGTEPQEASPIYQDTLKKLVDSGMPEAEAKHSAAVHDAFFSTLADRLGISHEAVQEKYKLEVTRGEAPESTEGVASLDQNGETFDQSPADRRARAEAMGFDTKKVYFHGTKSDIHAFDNRSEGAQTARAGVKTEGAHFFSMPDDPETASYYAERVPFNRAQIEAIRANPDISFEDLHALNPVETKDHPEMVAANEEYKKLYKKVKKIADKRGEAISDVPEYDQIRALLKKHTDIERNLRAQDANVIPVHLKFENPFTFNTSNPEQMAWLEKLEKENPGQDNHHLAAVVDWAKANGHDALIREGSERSIAVFDPSQIRSVFADFDPSKADSSNILHQGGDAPQARITIAGKSFRIDLFKDANASSFIHETGHMFLHIMKTTAESESAPEALKKDWGVIQDWLGMKEGDALTVDQHEKWATGFETYMRDGKAPSVGLEKAFSVFRNWLMKIYKTVSPLGMELSPDIRAVMDRMLASDDEIKRAARLSGYEMKDLPDVPDAIKGKIRELQERAKNQAEATLLKEQMKEVTAEHREALKVEAQRLDAVARPEVEKEPIFQAIKELSFDGEKEVNAADLAERGLNGEFTPEEATHFEVLAEQYGFSDGQDLAQKIVDARDNNQFEKEVRDRVNEGLKAHADLKDTALIREKALEAIHSSRSTELLALEREALGRLVSDSVQRTEASAARRSQAKLEAQAAKDAAKQILSTKSVKDAGNARIYITAERKAAERASRALAKKDYEAASKAKKEQLLNHALAAEAMRNKTEIEKSVKKLIGIGDRENLKDMAYGFTRQIDQVLSRFGLKDKVPEDTKNLTAIAQDMLTKGQDAVAIADATGLKQDQSGRFVPESLSDFVARANENYYAMSLPDTVMNGAEKPYKQLTLAELRQVRDGAETLQKAGQTTDRYLEADRKATLKAEAARFRAVTEENFGTPKASDLLPGSQHANKIQLMVAQIKSVPAYFDRWLDTISTTCRKFDGLEDHGPAQENISRPLQAASDRKLVRTHEAIKRIDAILGKHYTPEEFSKYSETRIETGTRPDGTKEYFTKEEILSMALNTGNEGNRQRLLTGFKWSEEKLQSVLSHLGKKDWDFCQDTWNHIGEYWPEIKKLEMDVNGYDPKGVEARAFTNEHGDYEGGYYPIAYDFEKSAEALQNQQSKDALYKQFSTAKAATEQGHTEARASRVDRPLRLSLDVLREHHENVIHDLEFRRAVIDVNRFLMQTDTKAAIMNAIGPEGFAGIQDWLKGAAGSSSEPSSFGQQAFRWFRFKTTMYSMGYRLATAPKIFAENAINLASENGVSGATRAMINYMGGASGIHEMVMDKSPFMKERATHLDRDQADILEKFRGTKQSLLKQYAFGIHAKLDQMFSVPLWNDVYSRAFGSHGDDKLAVTQADEAVRRAFMSGSESNQSKIMRGGEGQKMLTVAFGYSNMMWNRFSEQKFQAGMQLKDGEYGAAMATIVHASAYTFLMPAIVTALTRELMHNSQASNPDDKKKRMAASLIEEATPLKFVPVLRDAFPYLVKKATGEHSSFSVTPMESALTTLLDPAAEAVHSAFTGKKLPDRFPEQALNALSYTAGVPKQVDDLAMNFMDWQKNHGAAAWQDFVSRRTKK